MNISLATGVLIIEYSRTNFYVAASRDTGINIYPVPDSTGRARVQNFPEQC